MEDSSGLSPLYLGDDRVHERRRFQVWIDILEPFRDLGLRRAQLHFTDNTVVSESSSAERFLSGLLGIFHCCLSSDDTRRIWCHSSDRENLSTKGRIS